MNRTVKLLIIIAVIAWGVLSIYPDPDKKLKPGIDLAGGTSLLYQIDTTGMQEVEKREIAQNMIRILRQRVDPSDKLNLVFRAHGADRIEIQMPLASKETRQLRQTYMEKRRELEQYNLDLRKVTQLMVLPAGMNKEEYLKHRTTEFDRLCGTDANRRKLLEDYAQAGDKLNDAQQQLQSALEQVDALAVKLDAAKISTVPLAELSRTWAELDEAGRTTKLAEAAGAEAEKQNLAKDYIVARRGLAQLRQEITGTDGLQVRKDEAWKKLQQNNIEAEWLEKILENIAGRGEELARLKNDHAELSGKLDDLVVTFDAYQKMAGRLDDPESLKRLLKGSGVLEFRILPTIGHASITDAEIAHYRSLLAEYGPNPKKSGDEKYAWRAIKNPKDFKGGGTIIEKFAGREYVLASNKETESLLRTTGGGSWRLKSAFPDNDQNGAPAVSFTLDEVGGKFFLTLTRTNIERPLCILLDDEAISAPVIRSAIKSRGEITGRFTYQEVRDLADILNAGSLPARLSEQPISQYTVSATVGQDNLDSMFKAGVYGAIGTVAFMLVFYLVAGVLADVAVLMNLMIVIAVMAATKSTFTMPGIAGLILTIGMSVDANVLINERIREEQQRGSSLRIAIKNGYDRAMRTIMDSNITTFIPALFLWLVASEEVKGFALTLMIGLVSNLFTAVFVTRVIFDLLISGKILKNQLTMMKLMNPPRIPWMNARWTMLVLALSMVVLGWVLFFGRDEAKNSKYSIEFTGGTSVHVVLNEGVNMDRAAVEKAVSDQGRKMGRPAIEAANVQQIGDPTKRQYEIVTTDTNRLTLDLTYTGSATAPTAAVLQESIHKAAERIGDRRLGNAIVTADQNGHYKLETNQTNVNMVVRDLEIVKQAYADLSWGKPVVDQVVNEAVLGALAGKLNVQDDMQPTNIVCEPITAELVSKKPYLQDYQGGLFLSASFANGKKDTPDRLKHRFSESRFTSEFDKFGAMAGDPKVFGESGSGVSGQVTLTALNNTTVRRDEPVSGIECIVTNEKIDHKTASTEEWSKYASNEQARFESILKWTTSLPQVTQIDPSVGRKSMNQALVAIVLSMLAMIVYIWVRFGTFRFGLGAVVAVLHDVSIAIALVAGSAWLGQTALGRALGISDFKIDMPMIAAFLTVVGYSINDTIVVFDRIRETRGKMGAVTTDVINRSINQTLSRTLLTGTTTLMVLLIMYIWGGQGLRGFNFVLLIGILVGTYSSTAVASPLLLLRSKKESVVESAK